MSTHNRGAAYLTSESPRPKSSLRSRSHPFIVIVAAFLAVAVLIPSFAALVGQSHQPTTASALSLKALCGDGLISGSDRETWGSSGIDANNPAANTKRTLNGMELFGSSIKFVNYHGESAENEADRKSWVTDDPRTSNPELNGTSTTPGSALTNNVDPQGSLDRVYGQRNAANCFLGDFAVNVTNLIFGISGLVERISAAFATYAFSSNIVCSDATAGSTGNGCIGLLFITGGDGTDAHKGLIGALTSSIYMPLLVLVGLFVAIWIFYTGIIQRKFREAIFGFIWSCAAVMLGLGMLLNPSLLAKAPAAVSNTMAGCVIAAFGGDNCVGGSTSTAVNSTFGNSDLICSSHLDEVPPDQIMGVISSSLNCSMWKAFILEPWSRVNFGTDFANLDTKAAGSAGAQMVKDAGLSPDDFCVSMKPTQTLAAMRDKQVTTANGTVICNIAIYQLYLQTNANSTPNPTTPKIGEGDSYDEGWYRIIDVASTNDSVWNNWAGGTDKATEKMLVGFIVLLASAMGNFVIFIIAAFALVYYVVAIMLMAFAPLFFLIGVHPGKGRDILKGYGEMVLSNVFKYVASALFLIVALALYGGVLGNSTGFGMTFIIVTVLSIALFLYRREIVDLIGTVNMGGTKLGQATTDKIKNFASDKVRDTKRMATITAGSTIGGLAVAGAGGARAGFTEGLSRELKREGGLFGRVGSGIARGAEYAGNANRDSMEKEKAAQRQTARDIGTDLTRTNNATVSATKELDEINKAIKALEDSMRTAASTANDHRPSSVASTWTNSGDADKAAFGHLEIARRGIIDDQHKMEAMPAGADRDELKKKIVARQTAANEMHMKLLEDGKWDDMKELFNAETAPHYKAVAEYNDARGQIESLRTDASTKKSELYALEAQRGTLEQAQANASASADAIEAGVDTLRRSQVMNRKHVDRIVSGADVAGNQASEEAYNASTERYRDIAGKEVAGDNLGGPMADEDRTRHIRPSGVPRRVNPQNSNPVEPNTSSNDGPTEVR